MSYARALDICRTTTLDAVGIAQRWGVIEVKKSLASGGGMPVDTQSAVLSDFGANTPRYGDTLVALSTAVAADSSDPGHLPWQGGTEVSDFIGSGPVDWLQANMGKMPSAPGCPEPGATSVRDPVMLTLTIRVPTNAKSFSISSNFMSAEYPEWVCSDFNDFFVILLKSEWDGVPANPHDGNLAFYTAPGGETYPLGVNLAKGTGLFRQCVNGTIGCSGDATDTATSCESTSELVGTGFDVVGSDCGTSGPIGGGTGWLRTRGNVVPGEVMELRIAVWDTSDGLYDSVALIDSFEWDIEPAEPGTETPIE
jgi:hypothetical protein